MELSNKENAQGGEIKEAQESCTASRQPLQDVINCNLSSIPVPSSKCRIPIPQKYGVSKLPGPRPSINTKLSRIASAGKLTQKSQSAFRPVSSQLQASNSGARKEIQQVPVAKETLTKEQNNDKKTATEETKIKETLVSDSLPKEKSDLGVGIQEEPAAIPAIPETQPVVGQQSAEHEQVLEWAPVGVDVVVQQVSPNDFDLKETTSSQPASTDTVNSELEDKEMPPSNCTEKEYKEMSPSNCTEKEYKEMSPSNCTEKEYKEMSPSNCTEKEYKEMSPSNCTENEDKEMSPSNCTEKEDKEMSPSNCTEKEIIGSVAVEKETSVPIKALDAIEIPVTVQDINGTSPQGSENTAAILSVVNRNKSRCPEVNPDQISAQIDSCPSVSVSETVSLVSKGNNSHSIDFGNNLKANNSASVSVSEAAMVPATKGNSSLCPGINVNQILVEFTVLAAPDVPRGDKSDCRMLKQESTQMSTINHTSAPLPTIKEASLKIGDKNQSRSINLPDQTSSTCPCFQHQGKVVLDATEYETLKNDIRITRKSILLLERLNKSSHEELFEATCQVGGLAAEIEHLKNENKELSSEVEGLHLSKQLSDEAEREMTAASLRVMEERLQQETQTCVQLKRQEEELKMTQTSLFTELEARLSQQDEKIKQQHESLDYRADEIEEHIGVIEKLSSQLEQIEGVKDSMEFLEAEYKALVEEHSLLKESHGTALTRLEVCEGDLAHYQNSLHDKEKQCEQFESELTELRKEYTKTKTELAELYSVAKERLTNQNGEVMRYSKLVGHLSHEMIGLLKSLLLTAGMKVSPKLVKDFGQKSDHPWMHSVVSSVLQAVGETEDLTAKGNNSTRGDNSNNGDNNKDNSSMGDNLDNSDNSETNTNTEMCELAKSTSETLKISESTKKLSTFSEAPVKSHSDNSTNINEQVSLQRGLCNPVASSLLNLGSSFSSSAFQPVKLKEDGNVLSGIENFPQSTLSQRVHQFLGDLESTDDTAGEGELTAQTEHLSLVLAETVRINRILEEAAALSIRDLSKDNDSLKNELGNLETDLEEKDKEIEHVLAELATEKGLTQRLASEKRILLDQHEELLKRVEENVAQSAPVNSVAAVESRFYKETLNLKKNIYIVKEQLSQKDEEIEKLNETAVRRIKVWRENCVKADREVSGLDKIIENARHVLYKNRSVFSDCAPLQRLLKELDGKLQNADDSILRPLEPVKTTMW